MKNRKILSGTIACAMAMNCLLTTPFVFAEDKTVYEFEDGKLTGSAVVKDEIAGFSGSGYVFIENAGDTASVDVAVPEDGMYTISISFDASYGDKIQELQINGASQGNLSFSGKGWGDTLDFGPVKLNKGKNTVTIVSSWGWMNLDSLTIAPASLSTLQASNQLSDKKATAEAQGLMNYLATVYGDYIISGQQEYYNQSREDEFEFLKELTGDYPAIRGFDLGSRCNGYAPWDDGSVNRILDWVDVRGGIATVSWHANVPKDMASWTEDAKLDWSQTTYKPDETDFSPTKIITDKDSKEYKYWRMSIESLAESLQLLQDKNVPIIFRPLHEAEGSGGEMGSWFWWGKDGSATYKALWKLMYETLTEEFGLHNLIWEFNSYTYSSSKKWYPGDAYVDLVGYDKYNSISGKPNESAISSTFYSLVDMYGGAGKMVAMAECDTIPAIQNMVDESAYWLYFCPWYDGDTDSDKWLSGMNNHDTLKEIYQSEKVITMSELPDYKTYKYTGEPFVPAETEETSEVEIPTEAPEGHAKLDEVDGKVTVLFPEAVGESAYLTVKLLDKSITYANGCLGASVEIDGEYYWISYMWETTKSGNVKVDFTKPFNVTLGVDPVEDEAIVAAAIKKGMEQKKFEAQVWYAGDADEQSVATKNVTITDAFLDKKGSQDPTEPATKPTEEPTAKPTKPTEDVTESDNIIYGDVNLDGAVNVTDVIKLAKATLGADTLEDKARKAADVDLNEKIDSDDVSYLIKSLVQLITLPVA